MKTKICFYSIALLWLGSCLGFSPFSATDAFAQAETPDTTEFITSHLDEEGYLDFQSVTDSMTIGQLLSEHRSALMFGSGDELRFDRYWEEARTAEDSIDHGPRYVVHYSQYHNDRRVLDAD